MNANAESQATNLLAHRGRQALHRLNERESTRIVFPKMDREDWREYGEVLFTKRAVTPSDQEYGAWIVAEKLDGEPATDIATRSNAIWLHQNWSSIVGVYTGKQHHPTHIRTECRKAGHEWAGKTQHESKRRAESRRTYNSERYSWARIAIEEKVLTPAAGGGSTRPLKQLLVERWPEIQVRDPTHEEQLREACRILKAERESREQARQIAQREAESKREQAQAAKAQRQVSDDSRAELEAEYSRKHADLQTSFAAVVQAEIAARLPDAARREIADARAAAASARELEAIWRSRMESCKKGVALVMDNWRAIVGCLHPDRAPEDRREQFARASDVVLRVKDQFAKTEYGKW
jgi:hypothetical protein